MLPGTIVMLLVTLVVVYGGSGMLLSMNMKNESKKKNAGQSQDSIKN